MGKHRTRLPRVGTAFSRFLVGGADAEILLRFALDDAGAGVAGRSFFDPAVFG
jgi:hypothetical protein